MSSALAMLISRCPAGATVHHSPGLPPGYVVGSSGRHSPTAYFDSVRFLIMTCGALHAVPRLYQPETRVNHLRPQYVVEEKKRPIHVPVPLGRIVIHPCIMSHSSACLPEKPTSFCETHPVTHRETRLGTRPNHNLQADTPHVPPKLSKY
ncbi:hypothetical protein EDC01DRAFT_331791 [Geopyxis carbonaria]|nr:hypothetical protein EDC01DRAFT_331791 [Geopyxis carbonaria]